MTHEITPFASFVGGGGPEPSAAWGLIYCRYFNADQALEVTVMSQPTILKTEAASVKPAVDFNSVFTQFLGSVGLVTRF